MLITKFGAPPGKEEMNILIIDDEPDVREMISRMLREVDYEIHTAEDGVAGLQKFHEFSSFDLVITDIIMPEMEGIETIRQIKARSPKTKILAISGGGRGDAKNYLSIALSIGADSVLSKPFVKQELMNHLEKLFPDCGFSPDNT